MDNLWPKLEAYTIGTSFVESKPPQTLGNLDEEHPNFVERDPCPPFHQAGSGLNSTIVLVMQESQKPTG